MQLLDAPLAIVDLETTGAHHARLAAALGALKSLAWPWRGPVGVVELPCTPS